MRKGVWVFRSKYPIHEPTFGAVVDRFIEEERLLEIKKHRPGELCDQGLSYATVVSYLSVLKHISSEMGHDPPVPSEASRCARVVADYAVGTKDKRPCKGSHASAF